MFRSALLAGCLLLLLAPLASAQVEVGAGYSNLRLAGVDNNLKDANGFGLNLRAGGAIIPLPVLANFRLGVDIGWRRYAVNGSGQSLTTPDKSDLDLFSADLRAAYRQPFGVFFIEPSLAAGGLVGVYSTNNQFNASSFNQSAVGWTIRPGLAAGVHIAIFTAGLEANYRWGRLDFRNNVGGNLRELYGGVFAGLSF